MKLGPKEIDAIREHLRAARAAITQARSAIQPDDVLREFEHELSDADDAIWSVYDELREEIHRRKGGES